MRLRRRCSESIRQLKWAWQRVFRGWDDRVLWSIDYWLVEHMRIWLRKMQKHKVGVPSWCFEDPIGSSHSEEDWRIAKEKWDEILQQMIDGFDAAWDLLEVNYEFPDGYDEVNARYEAGMKVFIENLFDLWT